MKQEYQVLARRYRPQCFGDIVGQSATVTTLRNAIKNQRLAHAYLFCGSHGTGKTSIARIFAKALNCQQPTKDFEPCNQCQSCKEITSGHSLDVLEIDGASHRGIDDIRQINDNVGYAAASGRYKVYIIDEVHMLTKEAFNALLKTLEEPPEKVKFLFATTEVHKVPATIVSRCQRFNLNRIAFEDIITTLASIARDMEVEIEDEALGLIANMADGGLRDAESILDQVIAFHDGAISLHSTADILAVMPRDILFRFDRQIKERNLAAAFELTQEVFSQGKDLGHFVETLLEHYRFILLSKLSDANAMPLELSEREKDLYQRTAAIFTQEQVLSILDLLVEAQSQLKLMPNKRIGLENILLKVIRTYHRVPVDFLIRQLAELEQRVTRMDLPEAPSSTPTLPPQPVQQTLQFEPASPTPPAAPASKPTPALASPPKANPQKLPSPTPTPPKVRLEPTPPPVDKETRKKQQCRADTLMQFAKVELGGTLERKTKRR